MYLQGPVHQSRSAVFHIGKTGFFNRVIIAIYNFVEVLRYFNRYLKQFLMIKFSVHDKPGQSQ